ncbi:MAG: hypothetical protein V7L06_28760 [Nostoc sp.]
MMSSPAVLLAATIASRSESALLLVSFSSLMVFTVNVAMIKIS